MTAVTMIVKKKNPWIIWLYAIALCSSSSPSCQAEPSHECLDSESIMVGEYLGRESAPSSKITFENPPMAYYHITQILKGPPTSRSLSLKYDFGDKSQTQPKDWAFSESMMPKRNSSWILFIPFSVPSGEKRWFETYRGSLGRMEGAPGVVQEIQDALNSDLYQSRLIVVATYIGCEHVGGAIEAYYKRIIELKASLWEDNGIASSSSGGTFDKRFVPIKYEGISASQPEQGLNAANLPEKGSKWILFIRSIIPDKSHMLETTDGARGRVRYSRQALDENLDVLEHLPSYAYLGCHKDRNELYDIIEGK
jgi:hypothetical protein